MGDVDFFVEIYVKNPQLIIFGGGHVSQPVAKIGKMLGFHVTVMDGHHYRIIHTVIVRYGFHLK